MQAGRGRVIGLARESATHTIIISQAWIDRDETVTIFNSRLAFTRERSTVAPLRSYGNQVAK